MSALAALVWVAGALAAIWLVRPLAWKLYWLLDLECGRRDSERQNRWTLDRTSDGGWLALAQARQKLAEAEHALALERFKLDAQRAQTADRLAFRRLGLINDRLGLHDRALDLRAQKIESEIQVARLAHERPALPEGKPMPPDLALAIRDQSEEWARDQLLQRANELYGQYRDWDQVRVGLGM